MCTSLLINTNNTRKSFTILADDDDSMNDRYNLEVTDNLPAISNKIKSVYHQNCIIPNEDFSILYNSIASKLQPPSQQITILNKNLYSPSKEFFNKVSSKLRDLRPKVIPKEEELPKMERPMFITTVKSGTFLEPPPEVAALLGLRKNSFNSNNSSNSSTGKTQNDRMYSFASKPRILKSNLQTNFASRSLFRVETRREKRETLNEPLPKITNDTSDGAPSYGNTMFDRRVARGSNFAAQRPNVISTEHVLSRQAEARRRAAVRQRAQIRARKLRLGTPPPIDGRRHGQIQTDKYLEELTERPPDKSIACQADLPVQHHSPVYSLDSNSNVRTGVEAETQIYPGDLPDIDDELPSVISSIVNKILQEAILEINDEIEVIRLRTLASEQKRAAANLSPSDENGVISKAQLHMLIQQAINELKQSEQSESNEKNYDDINSNQLLEKIFHQIKNMVTDVKFLSGIIKTQLENWAEGSNQNDEMELEQAENEQSGEENETILDTETTHPRRESLLTENHPENQTDEGLEQMDPEIDDYKTDDFEEESKDLIDANEDEIEVSNRQIDLNTDSDLVNGDNVNVDDSRITPNGETIDQPNPANEEVNSPRQPTEIVEEPITTANESGEQSDRDDAEINVESNQNTNSETNEAGQDIPNDSQSQINDEQRDSVQDQSSVIISEPNKEDNEFVENENNQTNNNSNTTNESVETINTTETSNDETNNSGQNNNNQSSETNNDNVAELAENNLSTTPATNQESLTIPTLNTSVLDPPVNEPNPEDDIVVTQTTNNDVEQSSENSNSTNQPTIIIPTLNASVLDPPIGESNPEQDIVVTQTTNNADEQSLENNNSTSEPNPEHDVVVVTQSANNDAEQSSENNSSTTANIQTLTVPAMNVSLLDPPLNDSNLEDETTTDTKDQSLGQEQSSANPSNDDSKTENNNEGNNSIENNSQENSTNPPSNNLNTATTTEPNNSGETASPENANSLPESDRNTINNVESNNSDGNTTNNNRTDEQPPSSDQSNPNNDSTDSSKDQPTTQNNPTSTEPSTNPVNENQSSVQTIEREPTSTNEDDNDVVAIHSSSAENQDSGMENPAAETTDTNDQTSESSNVTNADLETPLDNNTSQNDPKDIPIDNNNNEKLIDDDLEKTSLASNKPESPQERPSDTESVENNELQRNTSTSEDSNSSAGNSQNPLNEDESVQEPQKPADTESTLSLANDQTNESNQSNNGSATESNHSAQNAETISNSSTSDSVDVTVRPTNVINTTTSLDQEVSRPLVNGPTEPDDSSSNQSDIDVKNNNEPNSTETDKSVETNNNDSVIQLKNPTTVVQNGSVITNR